MYACVYICLYLYLSIRAHMHLNVYIYICTYLYYCVFLYIYICAGLQTLREENGDGVVVTKPRKRLFVHFKYNEFICISFVFLSLPFNLLLINSFINLHLRLASAFYSLIYILCINLHPIHPSASHIYICASHSFVGIPLIECVGIPLIHLHPIHPSTSHSCIYIS